ncbi:MAG: hypothetical protein RL322_1586 [Pseudomonadota bacterium]
MSLPWAVSAVPDPRLIQAVRARRFGGRRWITTHGAWVMWAGHTAWKGRRPIRTSDRDCSTPAARRLACLAELALNQRFSPAIYQGLSCLRLNDRGEPEIVDLDSGREGESDPALGGAAPIDWLIRMQRLPAADFLDRRLSEGRVSLEDAAAVAAMLHRLYRDLPASAIETDAFAARFVREIEHSVALLGPVLNRFPGISSRRLDAVRPILTARVHGACLVDGHGDLRPAHVHLGEEISLIDALDCDSVLRQVDPWEELCLLAMMAAEIGAAWFGPALGRAFESAQDRSRSARSAPRAGATDRPPAPLLAFYTGYHALVRARLAYAHLLDPAAGHRRVWLRRARRFAAMAGAGFEGWSVLG